MPTTPERPRHATRALLRAHLSAATRYGHAIRRCPVCHRLRRLALEQDSGPEPDWGPEVRGAGGEEGDGALSGALAADGGTGGTGASGRADQETGGGAGEGPGEEADEGTGATAVEPTAEGTWALRELTPGQTRAGTTPRSDHGCSLVTPPDVTLRSDPEQTDTDPPLPHGS